MDISVQVVVELGAGSGLVGVVAWKLGARAAVLTGFLLIFIILKNQNNKILCTFTNQTLFCIDIESLPMLLLNCEVFSLF